MNLTRKATEKTMSESLFLLRKASTGSAVHVWPEHSGFKQRWRRLRVRLRSAVAAAAAHAEIRGER